MKLNEKILMCRKRAGYSQEELAQRLNTSRQAISKWELGATQPELENIVALARVFGVTTDWLLMDTEDADTAASSQEPQIESESERQAGPAAQATASAAGNAWPEWVEHLPNMLTRMIRKWGWLYGVYIALGGAGFALFGFIATTLSSQLTSSAGRMFNQVAAPGHILNGMTLYDGSGNIMDPGIFGLPSTTGSVTFSLPNPMATVGTIVTVLGILVMIAGIVLAYALHPSRRKDKAQ